MPGALIVIDQDRPSSTSFGSPGVARNDLWLSRTIRPRCGTSGNTSFLWSLLSVPPTSTVTLNGSATATPDFDPDVVGNYRLQLVTNGGGPGNIQILVCSVRFDSTGTLLNRGWALPAFGETSAENNFSGNTRGYAPAFEFIFNDIRTALSSIGTPGDASSLNGVTAPGSSPATFDLLQASSPTALSYGPLTNNNVSPSANIECTKTDGNFSTVPISTTGNVTAGGFINTGLVQQFVQVVTTDYTILFGTDYAIAVGPHSGTLTISFQGFAPSVPYEFLIMDDDGVAVTDPIVVSGAGSTINGAPTYTINTAFGFVRLLWTGTEFRVIGAA